MRVVETDALIVVDVQNDFCPGGALAVEGGAEVVPVINRLSPLFCHHVYSRDWHPPDHCSFSAAPLFEDKSWPAHCVAGTPGAELHAELVVAPGAVRVDKGAEADTEVYSAFEGAGLAETLRELGITRLAVCGLATDYCVKATVLDGLREGFGVFVIEDAIRAVNVPPGNGDEALHAMREAGAKIILSGAIEA